MVSHLSLVAELVEQVLNFALGVVIISKIVSVEGIVVQRVHELISFQLMSPILVIEVE
jgi:hypothetical protein